MIYAGKGDEMNNIEIGCYMIGMVQTNFYFLHKKGEKETIVFDPADYGKEIYEELSRKGLEIKAIFLTHGHFDHILGVKALKEACGAPVYASALERDVLEDPELNSSRSVGRSCTVNCRKPSIRSLLPLPSFSAMRPERWMVWENRGRRYCFLTSMC